MEEGLLREAFAEFSRASEALISYYSILEMKVQELKEELKEAKEYLKSILDSLPVAVVVLEEGRVLFSNKKAQEFEEKCLLDRITFNGKKEGEEKISGLIYKWKKEPLKCDKKQGEIIVIEDVTEVEKMKERLELDERLKAMGEMALKIAHEIKNPLGSMELFASMLLKEKMESRHKSYVEHICQGIKSIDRVVNNLLSYTKPKAISKKKGKISDVVREVLDFLKLSLEESGIEVSLYENEKEPIFFDPHLTRLIVMNLLINAKEAMEKGGRIEIEVKNEKDFTVLKVCDNGKGMDEEVKKSIFNPFFTTKEKGLGLGLFTVYNAVKAHGGLLEVESKPNCGAKFSIFFPKDKE